MGKFDGEVVSKWLVQGGSDRDMELIEPFAFISEDGTPWKVPAGAVINGASIPRLFWTFASPFVGDYRRASVIHDYFCETKARDWKSTHRIFYHGCIADGVPVLKAKAMYAAVYAAGPRWDLAPSDLVLFSQAGRIEVSEGSKIDIISHIDNSKYERMVGWINEENPSLEEIENMADQHSRQVARAR